MPHLSDDPRHGYHTPGMEDIVRDIVNHLHGQDLPEGIELVDTFRYDPVTGEIARESESDTPQAKRAMTSLNKALTNPLAVSTFRRIQKMTAGDPRYANGINFEGTIVDASHLMTVAFYWATEHAKTEHDGREWYVCRESSLWVAQAADLFGRMARNHAAQ